MGYYLQIDTQDPQPVASLSGWGDMIRWVGSLPPAASALHHLCLYGWEDDADGVTGQLADALKSDPPKADQTRKTADNLLTLLKEKAKDAAVISVTDGLGAGD